MRSVRVSVVAIVVGVASVPVALAPVARALPAAAASTPGTVDIRVELDLPNGHGSAGPVVFERDGVTPGPGVELDHTAVAANPSSWVGSLTVDIDPVTRRITITPDVPSDFQSARVAVTGADFTGVSVVSDTLWINPSTDLGSVPTTEVGPTMARTAATAGGAAGVQVAWHIAPAAATGTIELDPHGAAVLAYTLAPATTVPCSGTSCPAGTTTPPTTTATGGASLPQAAPATPVSGLPTYTG